MHKLTKVKPFPLQSFCKLIGFKKGEIKQGTGVGTGLRGCLSSPRTTTMQEA